MELVVECFNRDPKKSAVPTVFRFTVKDSREAWEKLAWVSTEIIDPEKWIVTSSLSG